MRSTSADGVTPAEAARLRLDPARRHLVEHRLDQLWLGRHLVVGRRLVPALRSARGSRDAPASRSRSLEPEVVRQDAGNGRAKRVELPERVLADPEQDVDAEPALGHEPGELPGERVRAALALVVEEVLLGLVEDEQEVVRRARRVHAAQARRRASRPGPRHRVRAPFRRHREPLRQSPRPGRPSTTIRATATSPSSRSCRDHARPGEASSCPLRSRRRGRSAVPPAGSRRRRPISRSRPKNNAGVRARVVVGREALPRRPRADRDGGSDRAHATTSSAGAVAAIRPASRSR